VLILTNEYFSNLIINNNYINLQNLPIEHLHVTLLSNNYSTDKLQELQNGNYGLDTFYLHESCIYLYCPTRYGNTKLSTTFLEKKFKTTATTRNWKTIMALHYIIKGLM
jgi:uncharacterized protein (DUF1697 family)